MSEQKEPREFWIVWKSGYKNQATVYNSGQTRSEQGTHVIEYSAYDQLQSRLAECEEALELAVKSGEFFSRHADCKKESWSCRCEFCKDNSASKNLREARQALEKVKENS